MLLEVIAANLNDIQIINESKADRIEFCSNLHVGGLTPSYEDVQQACQLTNIPINVMIRASERSFTSNEKEFYQMLEATKQMTQLPINGIVVGVLKNDDQINLEWMKQICDIAIQANKQITFHKAFDQIKDKNEALDQLVKLGISTVLTAGGNDINESIDILQHLNSQKKVKILAGGGVNFLNVKQIKGVVDQIHVGTIVRKNNSWDEVIDLQLLDKMKIEIQ